MSEKWYRVLYAWKDAGTAHQIGAYGYNPKGLENAKKACVNTPKSFVFDCDGTILFPIDYAELTYQCALDTYGDICKFRCKHKWGAMTLAEIKQKRIATCNTSAGVSGQQSGIFKDDDFPRHTNRTGKTGKELLKVKRSLSSCVSHSNAINSDKAEWVFAGCLFKDLPPELQRRGNIYYYDSNAAVSAGNGNIFSTNNSASQLDSSGRYYSLDKVTVKSGYCFTNIILWVAHPKSEVV